MEPDDLTALDATGTLAAVEARVRARRTGEIEDLLLVAQWCDLHSLDPQAVPGAAPRSRGGDRLLQIGGEGSPEVAELCFEELAIARRSGDIATQHYAADVLDLRHRLPGVWAALHQLQLDAWVALKVARMSRKLGKDQVSVVDAAVSAAVHQPAVKLLAIAEAKVIEADPELHRAKLAEDARRTGVWTSRPRPGDMVDDLTGEPATLRMSAKLSGGAVLRGKETIDVLAEAIFDSTPPDEHGDRPSSDECRASAFELLITDPSQAADLLASLDADPTADPAVDPAVDPSADPAPAATKPRRKRKPATIVVHLTDQVLGGAAGVARVEEIGPVLLEQLAELLDGRELVVQPVIDLNKVVAVNGYEHPTAVKERTLLRTHGDVFPHSTNRGLARLDHDHPTPYDPQGPPGQTGDLNDAPLTRRHHRAKTHLPYECRQLALGAYRWISPHGLARIVTPSGTRRIEILRDPGGRVMGEIYDGPRIEFHLRT